MAGAQFVERNWMNVRRWTKSQIITSFGYLTRMFHHFACWNRNVDQLLNRVRLLFTAPPLTMSFISLILYWRARERKNTVEWTFNGEWCYTIFWIWGWKINAFHTITINNPKRMKWNECSSIWFAHEIYFMLNTINWIQWTQWAQPPATTNEDNDNTNELALFYQKYQIVICYLVFDYLSSRFIVFDLWKECLSIWLTFDWLSSFYFWHSFFRLVFPKFTCAFFAMVLTSIKWWIYFCAFILNFGNRNGSYFHNPQINTNQHSLSLLQLFTF